MMMAIQRKALVLPNRQDKMGAFAICRRRVYNSSRVLDSSHHRHRHTILVVPSRLLLLPFVAKRMRSDPLHRDMRKSSQPRTTSIHPFRIYSGHSLYLNRYYKATDGSSQSASVISYLSSPILRNFSLDFVLY